MSRIHLLKRNINRIESKIAKLNTKSKNISWLRLSAVAVGLILILLALFFSNEILSGVAIFTFLVVFNIFSFYHRKVKRYIKNFKLWKDIKSQHLARTCLQWERLQIRSTSVNIEHPFAFDLDIIGEHSLYRLIDNTTSNNGSQCLRSWLLKTTPNPDEIIKRQNLVKELIPLNRFRDKLTLQSLRVNDEAFDGDNFNDWLKADRGNAPNNLFLLAISFGAIINISLFLLNYFSFIPPIFTISFIIYVMIFLSKAKYVSSIFMDAVKLSDELQKVTNVLYYLEKYPMSRYSKISELLEPIKQKKLKPSRHLRKILILLGLFGFRANIIIQVLLNIVLPIDYYLAELFIRQKRKISFHLPTWVEVWYKLEALSALANFSYLNPKYQFPIFQDKPDQPIFRAQKLGHPLIRNDQKVSNNFQITSLGDIKLITGSNMSGKSTFLRTVGINLCLAYAGSVVNAKFLSVIYFRIFSCIKISDNLSEGLSYFYAEVKRLKQLLLTLDDDNSFPIFFLIDEIFKGTNNRERLEGSRAYIKALSKKEGTGIISTHDLELTALESTLAGLDNLHFQENIEKGKMIFDFKLRKGPCPTTNALKIMESEGLPIK